MALKKRTSKTFDDAELRAGSMESVDAALNLGSNLTLAQFKQLIADGRAKLNDYNQTLSVVDQKANAVTDAERAVRDYSVRMLAGVAAAYGKDSSQYEQSGGTRTSEQRKSAAKPAGKTPAS